MDRGETVDMSVAADTPTVMSSVEAEIQEGEWRGDLDSGEEDVGLGGRRFEMEETVKMTTKTLNFNAQQ